ncbi:Aromatic-ring hydroxylase-like protein [Cordyceps fumosorosea ARSEF 2679]|uniref:Aromatic-ring hydroxylase-like protein n=1 Tax=Cordyceps fumosorosea (strain ARSEF 2679) TaxID=1081104 RepID=A0A167N6A2_CORFA|nr:Aromatic-ring hydroxylase-like protein [Cordyceps fumosorosea ARSEF 2679]OAA55178.1 Aromatic-ring hydroxylase-like protein [Cordyceps fumosorosea ARSEF 2679]
MKKDADRPIRVGVVGAGVVGLTLTAGLLSHGVDAVLYEQASVLREIGTGIGLLPTAIAALEALSPAVAAGVRGVCFRSPYFLGLVDGATDEDLSLRTEGKGLYDLVLPDEQGRNLYTTARATLVTELLRHVPAERLELGKKVVDIVEGSDGDPVTLVFADRTTAEADVVVGCDGVKSRVRRAMLGDDHPAASCQYAHEVCYRALVDGPSLRAVLGPLADRTALYLGPGAYLIVYPVGSRANISLYVDDPGPPPPPDRSHGRSAPRAEAVAALARLGPSLRALAALLPEEVGAWALHDLHEHPLRTYVLGRGGAVCVAGDAAHAATSHHGAGAGVGVEDAAVLCELLARVAVLPRGRRAEAVRVALGLYDGARRERSQWLVWSSRRQGQLMKYTVPEIGADMAKIGEDLRGRGRTLLTWDVDVVLAETLRKLDARIAAMGNRGEAGDFEEEHSKL